VRHGVADEGHAAQDDVAADHAAHDRGHGRDGQRLGQEREVGIEQVGQEVRG
jgi:hypothetical protein